MSRFRSCPAQGRLKCFRYSSTNASDLASWCVKEQQNRSLAPVKQNLSTEGHDESGDIYLRESLSSPRSLAAKMSLQPESNTYFFCSSRAFSSIFSFSPLIFLQASAVTWQCVWACDSACSGMDVFRLWWLTKTHFTTAVSASHMYRINVIAWFLFNQMFKTHHIKK